MKIRLIYWVFGFIVISEMASGQSVVINEWMAKNSTVLQDEDGDFSDWVELYNAGQTNVDLGEFGLSDDIRVPYKWVFPSVSIQPGEYLLVFCSEKDRVSPPFFHTNFKLSQGEQLVLTEVNGSTMSSVQIQTSVFDISEGSVIDGSLELTEFYQSTPGSANLQGTLHNSINFSHEPGFYQEGFDLDIFTSEPHQVHFTVDGSEPKISDPIWNGTYTVIDRTSDANSISTIPTNAPNLGESILWENPTGSVFKGTGVRLRSFEAGQPTSHIISGSFFVSPAGASRYSLPVVSVLTDSLNLFDYDSGIYVPGAAYDIDPNGGGVWGTGNYHQSGDNWERRVHFELFNELGQLEFSQDLGVRIHGTGSTAMPQKSLRFYAREKYGERKMNHQFFHEIEEDNFDVILLRNMGQDFTNGVPQDVLTHHVSKDLNQAVLANRPTIVFINGEYWGIQNLRERYDKHFLQQFHESPKDSIDIISSYYGSVDLGDNVAFYELFSFLQGNDISIESNYQFVASRMDISDFIDNTLMRIYLGCYDWPGNNMKMWRERVATGKFKWLLLDNDVCIWDHAYNSLEHATEANNPGWPNPPESTMFLRKLLENENFKQAFISRMAELLNTVFDKDNVGVELSRLYEKYSPEYTEHQQRWLALESESDLYYNYEEVLNMIRLRPCYVREHFMEYFNLNESEFPVECDSSALYLVIDDSSSIEDLLLYPNPNNGTFDIQFPIPVGEASLIQVFDLTGRLVFAVENLAVDQRKIQLSVESIGVGAYVLKVFTQKGPFTSKLIIRSN